MTRTLITRDLAEPAGPEFDASVDQYTTGQVVPTLGTITGTWNLRPVGPCADPDNDDGWSYSIIQNEFHTYAADAAWSSKFQMSSWFWLESVSSGSTGHYNRIIMYDSTALKALALRNSPSEVVLVDGATIVPTGVEFPLREWIEVSLAFDGSVNPNSSFMWRRLGDTFWTTIIDYNFSSLVASNLRTGFAGVGGTAVISGRLGGFTAYSIDSIDDAMAVDDTILPPAKRRRHWYVNSSTGNDNNEGSLAMPWATIGKANTEMNQLGILPTVPDSTAVDATLVTIRDAATTDDHAANDAALETALDSFYAECDVLHIGGADFGDDALWVRTPGLVVTGDGGTPQLRHVIDPSEWTADTRPGVYKCPGATAVVLWEDDKWLAKRNFATSEAATLDALAADPDGTFYCDDTNIYLRSDADPATSGRVYTRSRYRTTNGAGTSAIVVGAKDVQIRDMTLRGTTLANKSSGDGIQAYCVQWFPGSGGICESRDLVLGKGSKHTHGVTDTAASSAFLRRRVEYEPTTPYASQSIDVDFQAGAGTAAYYYGCTATKGISGKIGQVNGDPLINGSFHTAHGTASEWCKFISCNFGRGTFFGQGTFVAGGVTFIDVSSGGGEWAEPLTVDRCLADYMPFGVWSGTHQCAITNSIIVPRIFVSNYGFAKMSGPATIQGVTIDCRESFSADVGPHKGVWDCVDNTQTFDYHGNLFLTTKGFGIAGRADSRVISADYNAYVYPETVRLITAHGAGLDFDTWAEWQARGHDANGVLLTSDSTLNLVEYTPRNDSVLGEFVPAGSVASLVGTKDYTGETRPATGNMTAGAVEVITVSVVDTVVYSAWDTANNTYIAEAVDNHTIYLIVGGAVSVATGTKASLGGGDYSLEILSTEWDRSTHIVLSGTSVTDGVIIPRAKYEGIGGLTDEQSAQLAAIETGVDSVSADSASIISSLQNIGQTVWSAAGRTLSAFGFKVSLTDSTESEIDSIASSVQSIGNGTAIKFQPLTEEGDNITLVKGDAYTTALGRSMAWDFPTSEFGDFSGKDVQFKATGARNESIGPIDLTINGAGTADQEAVLEITAEQTDVRAGAYEWSIVVDPDTNNQITIRRGCLEIDPSQF